MKFRVKQAFLLPFEVRIAGNLVHFVNAISCHCALSWAEEVLPSIMGQKPYLGPSEKTCCGKQTLLLTTDLSLAVVCGKESLEVERQFLRRPFS